MSRARKPRDAGINPFEVERVDINALVRATNRKAR
jgi:hypothetical protein